MGWREPDLISIVTCVSGSTFTSVLPRKGMVLLCDDHVIMLLIYYFISKFETETHFKGARTSHLVVKSSNGVMLQNRWPFI